MTRTVAVVLIVVALFAVIGISSTGCDEATTGSSTQVASTGATQVTDFTQVQKNSHSRTVEQQNIMDRIEVTTDPTKIMWIHMIALDGTIISRMAVRNKVTSSGKRLEPRHSVTYPRGEYGGGGTYPMVPGTKDGITDEFIQPDGTFGDSDSYIFWFDPQGRYHQWGTAGGLGYLLTDYPISLTDPIDEITGMYNAYSASQAWQEEQETQLGEHERGGR